MPLVKIKTSYIIRKKINNKYENIVSDSNHCSIDRMYDNLIRTFPGESYKIIERIEYVEDTIMRETA